MNPRSVLTRLTLAMLTFGTLVLAGPDHDHGHKRTPAVSADHSHSNDTHDHGDGHDDHDHDHGDEATGEKVKLSPDAIRRHGISVAPVRKVALAHAFDAPARVAFNAEAMAHVGTAVAGRVSELRVKLGTSVRPGDALLTVDSPELGEAQSDFLLKRSTADTAQSALRFARDAHDRALRLLEQNQSISLAEVQKREAEVRAVEGNLLASEAAVRAAKNKLSLLGMTEEDISTLARTGDVMPRYIVVAPIEGVVVELEVTPGELVQPDQDRLLVIANLQSVWVIADIPEVRLADAVKGVAARIHTAAMKDRSIEGVVSYVGPALDPLTRSVPVRLEVSDPAGTLKPGMFAKVTILPAAAGEAVLAIPQQAVHRVQGSSVVFVPVDGKQDTFATRQVTIGPPVGDMVEVLDGLKENDTLVVFGSFLLKAELGKSGASHEH